MVTSIQISKRLHNELKERKLYDNESYEEVIWDMLEDTRELNEETKKEIALARRQAKEGKVVPFDAIKKKAGA